MWLCEGKLKAKIAQFRLPSASHKMRVLSSLMAALNTPYGVATCIESEHSGSQYSAEVFCGYPEMLSDRCCSTCGSHDDGACVIKVVEIFDIYHTTSMVNNVILRIAKATLLCTNAVSFYTLCQIKGIRLLVKWLRGREGNHKPSAQPVLRLLDSMLAHKGDLQQQGCVR